MTSFEEAIEQVKRLKTLLTNNELLELYGLYKQITVGDNNTAKSGLFDVKGKAKWSAWESKKGKSQADAQNEYINFVSELIKKYDFK